MRIAENRIHLEEGESGASGCYLAKERGRIFLATSGLTHNSITIKQAIEFRDALTRAINWFGPNEGYVR